MRGAGAQRHACAAVWRPEDDKHADSERGEDQWAEWQEATARDKQLLFRIQVDTDGMVSGTKVKLTDNVILRVLPSIRIVWLLVVVCIDGQVYTFTK